MTRVECRQNVARRLSENEEANETERQCRENKRSNPQTGTDAKQGEDDRTNVNQGEELERIPPCRPARGKGEHK